MMELMDQRVPGPGHSAEAQNQSCCATYWSDLGTVPISGDASVFVYSDWCFLLPGCLKMIELRLRPVFEVGLQSGCL